MKNSSITLESYPQYLDFRRKRLNIIQVMLIDTLTIKDSIEK